MNVYYFWYLRTNRSRNSLGGSIQGSCVYTCSVLWLHICLVSSHGADLSTVLFSHVVESWKSTDTRILWLFWKVLYSCLVVSQGPDQCTQAAQYRRRPTNQLVRDLTNQKPQKLDKHHHLRRTTSLYIAYQTDYAWGISVTYDLRS